MVIKAYIYFPTFYGRILVDLLVGIMYSCVSKKYGKNKDTIYILCYCIKRGEIEKFHITSFVRIKKRIILTHVFGSNHGIYFKMVYVPICLSGGRITHVNMSKKRMIYRVRKSLIEKYQTIQIHFNR